MRIILLLIALHSTGLSALNLTDSLLVKGDKYFAEGDLVSALEMFYKAEKIDVSSEAAKTGIYNSAINSGRIKTANKYAYKLIGIKNSELNQDRVIYSDALLGKISFAEKLLKTERDYFRRKTIYSLTGFGLSQTGYLDITAAWYDKAVKDGFKDAEFKKGYSAAASKRTDDMRNIDIIFSLYDYGDNDLLEVGYNFNLNYNFGERKHKYNLNFVMQGTSVNPDLNDELGFLFYDDIGQYEIFGQYNYISGCGITFYSGAKFSWLINDYIQNAASVSAGFRFFSEYFRADTYIHGSALTYNTYDFAGTKQGGMNNRDFFTNSHTMNSLQYTFDGAFTFRGAYLGGVINIVKDSGSDYAEYMADSDRDFSLTVLSENIISGDPRFLYGVTAGYNNPEFDIFSSYTTGDVFLVNTSEGRYLNTNDSKLKINILGGVMFKKLFGDWVLGYTISYSDFENYTILTNSIIANYRWR
jgi:hypothetical protein